MTILLILFFIILAIVFLVLRHTKMCGTILIVTVISFLIVGNGTLPMLLLKPLESPYNVAFQPNYSQKKNAIVVLGAGVIKIPDADIVRPGIMAYSRIYEGLQLYQSCKRNGHKCTIVVSGGDALSVGTSEALLYKNELLKFNVEASDITMESESMNTYKNAEFTSEYLKEQNFERVFLVTSGTHMKRALLYFSHFGIKAVPVISDYIITKNSFFPSAYNFLITDLALHEYIGILTYHIYNLFDWNAKVSTKHH
jgi:uncharacterized SAM-binding protein YcdF (DUF218 family)